MTRLSDPLSPPTDVGAVIVTHNRADTALACVNAASHELDLADIVVVINDPAGAAPADIARLQERVGAVVLNERRTGYGANLNAGVRRLGKDVRYLLLLNDDVVVGRETISSLRNLMELQADVGLVGGQLVDEHGTPQPSRHRFPTLASELLGALMLPAAVDRRLSRRYADPDATHVAPDDVWPIGAALMARATSFRAVDGFDESFFLYSEELDLAFRLRQQGWVSRFCPEAVVQHAGAQSTNGRFERMLGESRWRYVHAHWSRSARVSLLVLLPVVYAWNSVYVVTRVVANPHSFRDKTGWWRNRWVKRPLPALRRDRHATESVR